MFVSVWYAKKMGRRFINNVRKAKRHRQRMMVGTASDADSSCDWLWGGGGGAFSVATHVRGGANSAVTSDWADQTLRFSNSFVHLWFTWFCWMQVDQWIQ